MSEGDLETDNIAATPLIYLVDRDEGFREEMVSGLCRLGLNVHGFDGAGPLYRAYAARPSDIVILDISLDGEDGLSIAAHLRASQSVGIILASARGSVDDRIKGLRTGADAYLVKPVDVRELAATIEAIDRRLNRRGIASPPRLSPVGAYGRRLGTHRRTGPSPSLDYLREALFGTSAARAR